MNMKLTYMKMKMNRRKNVMSMRDMDRKIMIKCKRKWTEMKMMRRTNVMSKREIEMNMNMKRRTNITRKKDTERKSLRIKTRRNNKTEIRM